MTDERAAPRRERRRQQRAAKETQANDVPRPASRLARILAGETVPRLSRSKAIAALRKRIQERPDTEAMWRTIWDFDLERPPSQNNDRACALVLGAILEQGLEAGLLSHFIPMPDDDAARFFGPPDEAPITFDVKIRMGFALGMYGTTSRDDLGCVRHVRNLFAHARTPLDFTADEVKDVCDNLQWIDKMSWGGIMGAKPFDARRRYIETVRHYYVYFVVEAKNGPIRFSEYSIPDLYS